jgi:hypothetical protein
MSGDKTRLAIRVLGAHEQVAEETAVQIEGP